MRTASMLEDNAMRPFIFLLTASCLFAQEQPVLLKASTMLDGKGGVRHNVTVVVEKGTIRRVGASRPVHSFTYNLAGPTLMPGPIDTHVHLASHSGPNGKVAGGRGESPATELGYAPENAYADLMAGVTTVQSVGSPIDRDLRQAINRAFCLGRASGVGSPNHRYAVDSRPASRVGPANQGRRGGPDQAFRVEEFPRRRRADHER
jgi:hypothetical protein